MSKPSKFVTDRAVDDPLIQDANYRFDEVERQYVDTQIRGLQQFLVDSGMGSVDNAGVGTLNDVAAQTETADAAGLIRFTGVGATVTGFVGGQADRRLAIAAVGGDVTVSEESASSAAANRMLTGAGDVVIPQGGAAAFVYDTSSSRWRLISSAGSGGGGGGGLTNGSNLGAGAQVFKDVSAGTLRHRTIKVAGDLPIQQDPAGGTNEIWIRPTPPGVFNPREYGAKFDGLHDDLPALNALMAAIAPEGGRIHWPPGVAWISDTWKITKPVIVEGGGGNGFGHSGLEVAPGRSCLYIDKSDGAGNSASYHRVSHLDLKSKLLIHPTANGATLGYAVRTWSAAQPARKGDIFVASGGASPTKCFRVTATGMADPNDANTTGVEPAWNTTVGGTTLATGTGGSITLTCEKLMAVHATSTAYAIGDRVWAPNDHRYLFECEVAGTSAGSRPSELAGGDAIIGVQVGGAVSDGGVTWRVKLACGAYVNADLGKIEHLSANGFTGFGFHLQGGAGQDARFMTYVDNARARELSVAFCGGGVYTGGSDANGWTINGLFGTGIGTLLPTPAAAYGANGLGGHILVDKSDAGGRVSDLYAQTSTGRPVLKTGNGLLTIISSYTELIQIAHAPGGYTHAVGGTLGTYNIWTTQSNVTVLAGSGSRGICAVDVQSVDTIRSYLDYQDGFTVHAMSSNDEHGNYLGWKYRYPPMPRGMWSFVYGNQNQHCAFAVSSAYASPDPGPGWLILPEGQLIGDPTSGVPLFDGDLAALRVSSLRGGVRKRGDRFRNRETVVTLTSDGYRGPAFIVGGSYREPYPNWGVPADSVEPTTNTGTRAGGEPVWKVQSVTTGISGAEPAWPGSPTPGVTTVTSGGVTFVYVGTTPTWEETGPKSSTSTTMSFTGNDRRKVYSAIASGSTTNATPTALTSGAITDECNTVIVAEVDAIKRDGSATAAFVRRVKIKRDGGTVTVGTVKDVDTDREAAFSTCDVTIDHDGAGNWRLMVTGVAATTIDWSTTITRTETTHA